MPDIRVDQAHISAIPPSPDFEDEPLIQLLHAVAGRDRAHGQQQLRRQVEELSELGAGVAGSWEGDPQENRRGAGCGVATDALAHRTDNHEGDSERFLVTAHDRLTQMQHELNRRRDQLERFHAEAEQLYRESLEMRLVSEQLWGEVLSVIPAAEAMQRVESIRQQLRASLRQSEEHLAMRRQEIGHAARQVQTRVEELHASQRAFAEWMSERFRQLDRCGHGHSDPKQH